MKLALYQAVEKVLQEVGKPMTTHQIATYLDKCVWCKTKKLPIKEQQNTPTGITNFVIDFDYGPEDYYLKKDDLPITELQVRLSVAKKQGRFRLKKDVVSLVYGKVKSKEVYPDEETSKDIKNIVSSSTEKKIVTKPKTDGLYQAKEHDRWKQRMFWEDIWEWLSHPGDWGCGSIIFFLAILIIISLVSGQLGGSCSSNSDNSGRKGSSCSSPKPTTYVQASVRMYLRSNYLKDPKSYESISWNVRESSDGYIVHHKFRAKNSFGGYVVENGVFYLDVNYNVTYFDIY
jgi:hypothetical protein